MQVAEINEFPEYATTAFVSIGASKTVIIFHSGDEYNVLWLPTLRKTNRDPLPFAILRNFSFKERKVEPFLVFTPMAMPADALFGVLSLVYMRMPVGNVNVSIASSGTTAEIQYGWHGELRQKIIVMPNSRVVNVHTLKLGEYTFQLILHDGAIVIEKDIGEQFAIFSRDIIKRILRDPSLLGTMTATWISAGAPSLEREPALRRFIKTCEKLLLGE